ncbi:hypothetical protein G7068_03365 [Leucobacter viscericola]|uniref:Uncharacterized protein n=1 Tax=Leucobacter viscericola TaxID=2714935 RepID=A0A6G7XCN4_9MICO|nr:hypothetical protein [Leucobacter viscericola]QIK62354.1 hypothetical protein G7068_03365 [Leucobacter viscericola]
MDPLLRAVIETAAQGGNVAIIAGSMEEARAFGMQIVRCQDAQPCRIYRTNGEERISLPAGGTVHLTSARSLNTRLRGLTLDLAVFTDLYPLTVPEIMNTVTACFFGAKGTRIAVLQQR